MLIMSNEAVRSRLDALISAKGEDYSSISRLIGRNAAYIQQFIKRGIPRRLSEGDRKRIARYFGVAEERSEEHTSELQSLMRISYAVFCLKKQTLCNIIVDSASTKN